MWEKIVKVYPELVDSDFIGDTAQISLMDDGDGIAYIAKWDYAQPIPTGLKLGK
jgi:hypothetical protein